MQLVRNPGQFDTIVTENLFGDILSDEAAVITGSIGMLPSASLGASGPGLYEPIHGSAPDIAGKGLANPIAMIGSFAMALRYSLGLGEAADLLEKAIAEVLASGTRTADIAKPGENTVSTTEMGAAIIAALVPRALRETRSRRDGSLRTWLRGILTWLVLVGVLGLPYWLVLIPLHDLLLSPGLLRHIVHTPQLLLTFGMIASLHARRAFTAGYDAMPEAELKQRVRWDAYLLILRAVAMFLMASPGFAVVLVPAMALVLSYFEIWPERALGATLGEASKRHEYDPHEAKPKRRRLP